MFSAIGTVNRHWQGQGVGELLRVATPVMIAQASSSLMMFTDRFLLTDLGKVYPASSMAGSFFALCCTLFFIGLLTYVTPLVAQYLGSGQTHRCVQVFMQGALLSILFSPIVHGVEFCQPHYFAWAKLPSDEALLAQEYLEVVLWEICLFFSTSFFRFF